MKPIIKIIKNQAFYIPFLWIIGFTLLGVLFYQIDVWESDFSFIGYPKSVIQTLLIMSIGAIITLVTITFSSIMVILTTYSGQFSPRTLNDFLVRKVPLNILGYFTGLLVYSALMLVLIQQEPFKNYALTMTYIVLSLSVGFVLFIYYIQYVAKAIQINRYIDTLVDDAIKSINTYKKDILADPSFSFYDDTVLDLIKDKDFVQIKSLKSGYITDYNKKLLLEFAKTNQVTLVVNHPLDTHVFKGDPLIKIIHNKDISIDEETLNKWIEISDEPMTEKEYLSTMLKLNDIAIRALSPGVNDPKTAIDTINQLGNIMNEISMIHQNLIAKEDESIYLIMQGINYSQLLYNAFYQVNLYGHNDLRVVRAMINAFIRIAKDNTYHTKNELWEFALYILKDLDHLALHPLDHKHLFESLYQLAVITNKTNDYDSHFKTSKTLDDSVDKETIKKENSDA